jgi:protein O-mannosyl-transferase
MRDLAEPLFSSRRFAFIFAIVLTALTIFVYRPAWNGGFLWDDDVYITNNELLTAPDGLRRIWFSLDSPSQYFPLVYTTFRVEHALWGLNPAGYHWVNLVLHISNALLVWLVLVRLKVPGAWLAGAIFALHPVQVESVAWITERKNVLMGFFFLLTLLAWIAFVDGKTRRRWLFYGLAFILYLFALSAKTTACTLPAALFLILWLQHKPIDWRRIVQIIPFLVLGIAMGVLAMWWERYHQGTSRAIFTFLSPIERILVASRAVWFYLSKLFWPSNLTFIYPRWDIAPTHLLNYVWLLAGFALCVATYFLRRYAGRSVEVAAAFFVATLSPVLGFIMLYTFRYTFVADHYQYLACIGPIALASAGLANLADTFKHSRTLIPSAGLGVVAVLATLTWRQAAMYGNIETLWRTTLARNPGCWMAHNNLGIVLFGKGQLDDAIAHYRTTLEMQSDFSDADYNLGSALLGKGQVDEAIFYCDKAVTMQPNDPDAQVALANALLQKRRIDDAIVHYQKAVAMRPDYFLARSGLGHALLEKGKLDDAIEHSRDALLIQPNDADCHTVLAIALDEKGQTAEAIGHYEKALTISPQSVSALNNLAWLLATDSNASLRNGVRAIQFAQQAEQLSGGKNALVLRTLAAAYAEAGQFGKAIESAQAAMQLGRGQGDDSLVAELQQEIALYELALPCREKAK